MLAVIAYLVDPGPDLSRSPEQPFGNPSWPFRRLGDPDDVLECVWVIKVFAGQVDTRDIDRSCRDHKERTMRRIEGIGEVSGAGAGALAGELAGEVEGAGEVLVLVAGEGAGEGEVEVAGVGEVAAALWISSSAGRRTSDHRDAWTRIRPRPVHEYLNELGHRLFLD